MPAPERVVRRRTPRKVKVAATQAKRAQEVEALATGVFEPAIVGEDIPALYASLHEALQDEGRAADVKALLTALGVPQAAIGDLASAAFDECINLCRVWAKREYERVMAEMVAARAHNEYVIGVRRRTGSKQSSPDPRIEEARRVVAALEDQRINTLAAVATDESVRAVTLLPFTKAIPKYDTQKTEIGKGGGRKPHFYAGLIHTLGIVLLSAGVRPTPAATHIDELLRRHGMATGQPTAPASILVTLSHLSAGLSAARRNLINQLNRG